MQIQRVRTIIPFVCHMYAIMTDSPKSVTREKHSIHDSLYIQLNGTKFVYNFTERNERIVLPESSPCVSTNTQDASHDDIQYLKSTFTIECIDPSLDATDEILQQFDSEESEEFDTIVPV